MSKKEIFILIGQKGSGKSFIGAIIDREFGIKFIRVEDWAKQIKQNREVDDKTYLKQVFYEIEKGIRAELISVDSLVFESTGLTEYFDWMLVSLKNDFQLTTIGIFADAKICIDRVKTRDQSIHINISDDRISMINEKVREKNFNTDFWIINENKTAKELTNEISLIIDQTRQHFAR